MKRRIPNLKVAYSNSQTKPQLVEASLEILQVQASLAVTLLLNSQPLLQLVLPLFSVEEAYLVVLALVLPQEDRYLANLLLEIRKADYLEMEQQVDHYSAMLPHSFKAITLCSDHQRNRKETRITKMAVVMMSHRRLMTNPPPSLVMTKLRT